MWPEPDFTQTCWPTLEAKLGRKMTTEENKKLMYRGGMFKEWFFNRVRECTTPEQAEDLLSRSIGPWVTHEPRKSKTSFLSKILEWIGR